MVLVDLTPGADALSVTAADRTPTAEPVGA